MALDDDGKVTIMTWLVAIAFTPAPAVQSPNMRAIDDLGAVASYYRAIVVTFASVRRWNPGLKLTLVTDCEPPARFVDQLAALDVQLLEAKFKHRPPDGFWPTFNASLYTIDVMARLRPPGVGDQRPCDQGFFFASCHRKSVEMW